MLRNERRGSVQSEADGASALAVEALAFLAGEPEELNRFLRLAGLDVEELRAAAREPGFLPGVLDYLLGSEKSLLAFCEASGTTPASVNAARAALSRDFASAPR